jgi:hypothetical protein
MPLFSRRSPADVDPLPYEPRSPEGLAARWVQWAAAATPLKNPIADTTGADAGHNQPDDVWFLAGSYGEEVRRRVVVPAGRELFLPVINLWFWPTDSAPEPIEDAVGSLLVNGVGVEPDVISTPVPFVVAGARLNGVTRSTKPIPTTVWGLWKHLAAPAPGRHELRIRGGVGPGFAVDVSYELFVGATDALPANAVPGA